MASAKSSSSRRCFNSYEAARIPLRLRPAKPPSSGAAAPAAGRGAGELRLAYVFLRNLEHRLQYLDDQQTQRLPTSDEDRHGRPGMNFPTTPPSCPG
jgi:hypothetical protein